MTSRAEASQEVCSHERDFINDSIIQNQSNQTTNRDRIHHRGQDRTLHLRNPQTMDSGLECNHICKGFTPSKTETGSRLKWNPKGAVERGHGVGTERWVDQTQQAGTLFLFVLLVLWSWFFILLGQVGLSVYIS